MKNTNPSAARTTTALALCMVLALAGCGGGGSDATGASAPGGTGGTASAAGTPTEPTPIATASTNGTTTPATGSLCSAPDISAAALARINQIRAAGADCRSFGAFPPAPALAWSPLLAQAAAGHSLDMATMNFIAHVGSGGSTLDARVAATGYAWQRLGENIVAGSANIDVDAAFTIWLSSDSHCANLMNPNFDAVGMACVPGSPNATHKSYWTMDLARAL